MSWRDSRLVGRVLPYYYVVSGRGGGHLAHKREFHRRLAEMERRFLAQAEREGLLCRVERCPACMSDQVARRFETRAGFKFAVCAGCSSVFMDPRPSDAALASLYNDPAYAYVWATSATTAVDRGEVESLLRLAPHTRGGRLLDVGCATGAFLHAAKDYFTAGGIELDAATARVARGSGLEVHDGRLDDLPPDARYDVISFLQVIEHVPDPVAVLVEARRRLRHNGVVYLTTPLAESASFRLLEREHAHVSSFGHVILLSQEGLVQVAGRAGLAVAAHESYGGLDVALHDLVARRWAPGRFRHRMALYSPRLYYASQAVERWLPQRLLAGLLPRGDESYQRAVLQAP